MTCILNRPDPQTLFNKELTTFSNQVLEGATVIPESNEWYVVSLNYASAEEFYAIAEQQWKEKDARYACCDNLIDLAAENGVYPFPAEFAQGYVRITGDEGAALDAGMQFLFGDQTYLPASTVPIEIPSSGEVVIRVSALVPGPEGNAPSTATGTITTPLPGVDSVVTVYGGRFCGGAVAETCEQFRSRYLDRISYKPNYGLEKIKELILAWPCVTSVCERGGECCSIDLDQYGKTVDCNKEIQLYAIFDGTFDCGLAPQCIVDEITEVIFGTVQGTGEGLAEWGMLGRVFTATPAYVNIIVDGLSCLTPSQSVVLAQRIRDFVSTICPSQILMIQDLKVIVSQLLGSTQNYDILIRKADPDNANIDINVCGDAVPACDHKICLNDIDFVNNTASNAGICV